MNRQEKIEVERRVMASKKLTFDIMTSALIIALHDEMGFGIQRLERVMRRMAKESDYMYNGMIGWMDYKEYAEEKTGLKLDKYYLLED